MEFKCLGTGSSGNCYLVNLGSGNFLLDCGVNFKKVIKAVNLNDLLFAFISHEHKDHAANNENLRLRGIDLIEGRSYQEFTKIEKNAKFEGSYEVYAFPVQHGDCSNCGCIVRDLKTGLVLLYITDFNICRYDLSKFKFDYLVLECNFLERNVDLVPEELQTKVRRQINTHMGLEGLQVFIDTLDLTRTKEIILIHMSEGFGDKIIMPTTIYNKYKIPTSICLKNGGLESYGR